MKKAPKKEAATAKSTQKTLDWARQTGIKTASRAQRAATAKRVEQHPQYKKTRALVLTLFRNSYPSPKKESDATILDTDRNDFDIDPSPFYEFLERRLGVPQDPENEYFGGYGGPIRDLIAFLTPRWDGKLKRI
jgi:hypothetical protein